MTWWPRCALPENDGLRRGLMFADIGAVESAAHDAAVNEILVELTPKGAKRLASVVAAKGTRPTNAGVDWNALAFSVPEFAAAATKKFCDEKDY